MLQQPQYDSDPRWKNPEEHLGLIGTKVKDDPRPIKWAKSHMELELQVCELENCTCRPEVVSKAKWPLPCSRPRKWGGEKWVCATCANQVKPSQIALKQNRVDNGAKMEMKKTQSDSMLVTVWETTPKIVQSVSKHLGTLFQDMRMPHVALKGAQKIDPGGE